MKVPNYVIDLMSRTKFNLENKESTINGYTIDIAKRTHYAYVRTLKDEAKRLVDWANREYQKASGDSETIAFVVSVPKETHFKYMQYATVTIYDPIMRHLEKYIPENNK